jgi:hypothetical protein
LERVVRAFAREFKTATVFIVGSQAILATMPGAMPEVRQSPEIDAFGCIGLANGIVPPPFGSISLLTGPLLMFEGLCSLPTVSSCGWATASAAIKGHFLTAIARHTAILHLQALTFR